MPQAIRQNKSVNLATSFDKEISESDLNAVSQKASPLNNVVSQLNQLSQSFVDSFQDLEGKVQQLSGELENESFEKENAIAENERLLSEKVSLSDRLQNLLSIMPAGVVVIDGNGQVKDCNAMAVDILGRPLLGEMWVNVIRRAFEPQADDGHQVSLKDGRKIHIETKGLNTEPGQLIVLTDLTKTRQLQAELSQQQKLSSMGKMVASLAHQIRTPLSAAILYGSQINSNQIDEQMREKFSNNLVERLHFMERQITDMLTFVRGERKDKQVYLVKEVADEFRVMTNEFSDVVKFQLADDLDTLKIVADKDALLGSLVNLVENAVQACNDKSLTNQKEESAEVKVIISADKNLAIKVEDNGKGIPAENINRIFEPFFSDKSQGNGLGLAIVHGTVIEHKGTISVESKINEYTRFKIMLPLLVNQTQEKAKSRVLEVVNER